MATQTGGALVVEDNRDGFFNIFDPVDSVTDSERQDYIAIEPNVKGSDCTASNDPG